MSISVGIIGMGRVGRAILRSNFIQKAQGRFNIRVLCDVMPISQVAYLIAHDSTYGAPPFTVDHDNDYIVIAGIKVRYIQVDRRHSVREDCGLGELIGMNIDVLVNATGTAQADDLQRLIDKNITKKILCSWNIKGGDISLVYGVNEKTYDPNQHNIISASTCTGNAMVPLAYVLDKHIGIEYARILTIHPVLADQHILDGFHPSSHLGRSINGSIIPTATNVGASTSMVLPSLKGKLDSFSYRVPTEIVSVLDVTATLSRDTSREECSQLLSNAAKYELSGIVHCDYGAWGHERVSIDFIGAEYSCIILMNPLSVSNKRHIGISVMHDNERGYSCRALDILGVIGKKISLI